MMLQQIGHRVPPDPSQARLRAEALVQQGLGPADAAHLAYAGQVGADFVTCDDQLIRQCRRVKLGIFLTLPRQRRLDAVQRHRQWQAGLDKDRFFDQVFGPVDTKPPAEE
jgi:hypothetical protein